MRRTVAIITSATLLLWCTAIICVAEEELLQRPFLCYALCVSQCMEKDGALTSCEAACISYNCTTNECLKKCKNLTKNEAVLPPTVASVGAEYVGLPEPNPYKIRLTWEFSTDVTLYTVQVRDASNSSDDWHDVEQLLPTPIGGHVTTMNFVFTSPLLCRSNEFRIIPVSAAVIGQPSTSVKVSGEPEPLFHNSSIYLSLSNINVTQQINGQPAYIVIRVRYTPPLGWKPNDFQLDATFIPMTGCFGASMTNRDYQANELEVRLLAPMNSQCEGGIAVPSIVSMCNRVKKYPYPSNLNSDGSFLVVKAGDYCRSRNDNEIVCTTTLEEQKKCTKQYSSQMNYSDEYQLVHEAGVVDACKATANVNWTLIERLPLCQVDYYLLNYGKAYFRDVTLGTIGAKVLNDTAQLLRLDGADNVSAVLSDLDVGEQYAYQVIAVFKDHTIEKDIDFRPDDWSIMAADLIDLSNVKCSESPNGSSNSDSQKLALMISVPLVLAVLVLCATIACILVRVRSDHKKTVLQGFIAADGHYVVLPHGPVLDDVWELDRRRLIIEETEVLGKGAFGKVYKGNVRGIVVTHRDAVSKLAEKQHTAFDVCVAIKQCYEYADQSAKQEFLSEISLMKQLGRHDKLVNMLHCITKSEPLCLVVEYCSEGDLLHYLRNRRKYMVELEQAGINICEVPPEDYNADMVLTLKDCISFGHQIADGMECLSQKGFLHRDIAARNVLVDHGRKVKIGDFGLCRYVYNESAYVAKGGKLPIKWMALEAIERYEFTSKSDVWSFGVLMFEIITLGGAPYADIMPLDGDFRKAMIDHLRIGKRMERPDNCPADLYDEMVRCWSGDPVLRPTFTELKEKLRQKLESLSIIGDNYGFYVDPNRSYYNVNLLDEVDLTMSESAPSVKADLSNRDSGNSSEQDRVFVEDSVDVSDHSGNMALSYRKPHRRCDSTESGIGMDEYPATPNMHPSLTSRDSAESDVALITPSSAVQTNGKFKFPFSSLEIVSEVGNENTFHSSPLV